MPVFGQGLYSIYADRPGTATMGCWASRRSGRASGRAVRPISLPGRGGTTRGVQGLETVLQECRSSVIQLFVEHSDGRASCFHPTTASASPSLLLAAENAVRRREYEAAERAAGRAVDPEVARRLGVGEELYPNCHVHIWLRSCKEEVCKPLRGSVTGKSAALPSRRHLFAEVNVYIFGARGTQERHRVVLSVGGNTMLALGHCTDCF